MILPSTKTSVLPQWIDHNGHMNLAYYVLAFDQATDAVYETWGLGFDYPDRENHSIFTIGINVDYLKEAFEGDPLEVRTQLLDMDHKRIHYVHSMYHDDSHRLLARNECLCINVDLSSRRSAPFPTSVVDKLRPVFDAHAELDTPDGVGRQLRISGDPPKGGPLD